MSESKLAVILEENQVENATEVKEVFSPFFTEVEKVKQVCMAIKIEDVSQVEEMEKAREYRLSLKKLRVAADKEKARLKEQPLRKCQAIDALARYLRSEIEPLEAHLTEQEKYAERKEQERKNKLKEEREQELDKCEADYQFVDLAEMPEDNYKTFLKNTKESFELRKQKEKEEEDKRKKEEEDERKRQEEIRKENEKLKKEAEEKDKAIEEERKKAQAEREKVEAEQEKKLKEERKKLEKVEAEMKAKKEEEERKEKEKAEQEKADEEARLKAEKDAALAPDKKKLDLLAVMVTQIELPEVKSKEAKAIIVAVVELLNKTSNYIKEKTINL